MANHDPNHDEPDLPSKKSSETAEDSQVLDNVLYLLMCQWGISDPATAAGKREQLHRLLKEIGRTRMMDTIQLTIDNHPAGFFPTIAQIRSYIPQSYAGGSQHDRRWWRDPACPDCHGRGLVYVPDPEADRLYKRSGSTTTITCRNPHCLHRED